MVKRTHSEQPEMEFLCKEVEFLCKKGEQVILTDNCRQSFLGLVKSVNYGLGRIVLSEIVQLPDRKIISGYRNFDKSEITEIRKYEADGCEDADKTTEEDKQENTIPEPETNRVNPFKKEYCFIQKYGTDFQSAIASLRSCTKVGLHGKDMSKGRCQRGSVVALSTPSKVFIFDFQNLGDDTLHKELKGILESPAIIKVLHDCRLLSDCLRHKHLIRLEGVRDVEAEDIMLVYQERLMIRKHSRPLEYLIKMYLGLEVEGLDAFQGKWGDRPLPPNQLEALASLTACLVPLQEAIEQKYLKRLIDASKVYNTYVRSLDFFEFLHTEQSKTLRAEMVKVVSRQTQARAKLRAMETC